MCGSIVLVMCCCCIVMATITLLCLLSARMLMSMKGRIMFLCMLSITTSVLDVMPK